MVITGTSFSSNGDNINSWVLLCSLRVQLNPNPNTNNTHAPNHNPIPNPKPLWEQIPQ